MLPAAPLLLREFHRWRTPLLQLNLQSPSPELSGLTSAALRVFAGAPILLELRPQLRAWRGKLLSADSRGTPVYAASFIRQRCIVLETELLESPDLFRSILLHELFHFAWVRLGNRRRDSFAELLHSEWKVRARGELGESAGVHKDRLSDKREIGGRRWRDYRCESFCDSGAYFLAGPAASYPTVLSQRWRERRYRWFEQDCRGPLRV